MKKKKTNSDKVELRLKAEKKLELALGKIDSVPDELLKDVKSLIHELQVHEIELEMQNDELRKSQLRIEQSRQKYSDLYNFAPSAYFTFDKDGKTLQCNLTATNLFGKTKSSFLNTSFYLTIVKEDRDIFYKHLAKALETKTRQSCELKLFSKDGTIFYGHLESRAEQDSNGKFINCQTAISNITDLKRIEEELIQARIKAEESDRLKSAFLANMSHEIRTPMNSILGFTSLLREPGITGQEQHQYIDVITQNGERLLDIINDIIDISLIETGEVEIHTIELNIYEQLEYFYNLFRPEVEDKGMQLSFKISLPSEESTIRTDGVKFCSILTNLLKNAIKYSNDGSIEFGYKRTINDPVELEFFVKDTGIGIPIDKQKDIFQRFSRVDGEGREAIEGAGLGLAITKAYVEKLGGKIWVESKEQNRDTNEAGGSTFYFTLPYDVVKNDKRISADVFSRKKEGIETQKLNILLADDQEAASFFMTAILRDICNDILHVKTGNETVQTCRNNPDLDLILMDIRMPELNGYEATRQIRKFNKDIIIIAQTAFALSGDRKKAIEAGCNDYISKPFVKEKLIALLEKYFNI